PGAVLTRVAASHLRIGTFQYFAAQRNIEALQRLFDYTCARHYPQAETPGDLLRAVIARQARLVAQWMGVGFIHGVMNTDNTALSGETIDYGPCAFMDHYNPEQVYSFIDRQGRYRYNNQGPIACWNLSVLASCLVPLVAPEAKKGAELLQDQLDKLTSRFDHYWLQAMGQKLGI